MEKEKYNLFVYGSLRDAGIMKSVSGFSFTRDRTKQDEHTLLAEPAMLTRYRKVSPDNVYFYAVANPSSRIDGFVIYDIPAEAMAEIDKYEGKRYDRETVHVNTAKGLVRTQAYLASHAAMKQKFGDRFQVNLIHELWLRKRIEEFIKSHTRPGDQTADAELERRARRELLGTTERDLIITHYRSDAVSDYYLKHELDRPIPSINHLRDDPEAGPFIVNYLALVIKHTLLNQLDEKIRSHHRFELEHMRTSPRYFRRSIGILIALQMINANRHNVDLIIRRALETMPFEENDLLDYVKYAVSAADSIFESRVAEAYMHRIRSSFNPGIIPLGAEIELSNVGSAAVDTKTSSAKTDIAFDRFRYFRDFGLDTLSWKLGGYIDDHSGSPEMAGRRGFLELAPGRLNIAGELSRPATAAPWLLNQLIHAIVTFYNVSPHSLHLSFQLLKHQVGNQRILPLDFVKCLLVLGGGLEEENTGRLFVSRVARDEITQREYGEELVFARTSKRSWFLGDDDIANKPPLQTRAHIQQYKFIRLDRRANYEPLIMCLKGLQMSFNPADYLTAEQLKQNSKLRRQYEELKAWAANPGRLSNWTIKRFIDTVQDGLMNEAHHRPAHKLHYIDWVLSAINVQLRMFNEQIKKLPKEV